jgi:hypothetical protein
MMTMSLQNISKDTLCDILIFLTDNELGAFNDTCRLFHSDSSINALWMKHCLVKWGIEEIDIKGFEIDNYLNYREIFYFAQPMPNEIITYDNKLTSKGNQVSFYGIVGEENRSVRATIPFPKIYDAKYSSIIKSFIDIIFCRYRQHLSSFTNIFCKYRPFVVPFLDKLNNINISKRFEAYYEVEITRGLGKAISLSQFNLNLYAPVENDAEYRVAGLPDCVAIGLASSTFCAHTRFPGWDSESYGYHGDDGGIFHGQGNKVAEFGPSFGVGDTIGCGINYRKQTIFFTLNGVYLGDAFSGIKGEFFPTVGIDAAVNINFNFGRAPFVFDLAKYSALNRS